MTRTFKTWKSVAVIAVAALTIASCGGDDDSGSDDTVSAADSTEQSDEDDFGEALSEAAGAGGGGILIFDGEEIPITSVACQLGDDTFDVGGVSDNDYRVFVTRSNPLNDIGAQILDSDFLQWFPQGSSGDEAQRDGGTFTSETAPYFNNSDDRIVDVSFTIECP